MRRNATRPTATLLAAVLLGCAGPAPAPQPTQPDAPAAPTVPQDPLLAESVGIARLRAFTHPDTAGHFGVDVVRMPYRDPAYDEWRDRWLFASATGAGIYLALVADDWSLVADTFVPVAGLGVPWTDLRAGRIVQPDGTERAMVYYVSRGTDRLEILDVTAFPELQSHSMPLELDLPVKVRGAHTLQLHEQRGVLVLNGIDVTGQASPPPLTYGAAPAQFYDVGSDPMQPRRLSMFLGPEDGDQVLFDSQFLTIDGRDVWAPTIAQPQRGGVSYFAFYDFADAAHMDTAKRLTGYGGPGSGTMHNVVQLPPTPDGRPRLAAGFEAWAFAAGPDQIVSKAGVLDATGLLDGTPPRLCAFLIDGHNRRHAVHNPASRLLEWRAHTWDTVPLAHFTGGYFVYRCGDDQDSVAMLAHAPLSQTEPGMTAGRHHPRMGVPTWLACYNGAWDAVASPIGDWVSSTDRECSYLIEPSWGFVRQFGTYMPRADGEVPRIRVTSGVPTVGQPVQLEVTGLQPGGRVTLLVSTAARSSPVAIDGAGAIWCDLDAVLEEHRTEVATDGIARFALLAPDRPQLVLTAYQRTGDGDAVKAPAVALRLHPGR
ncbi:MAG: hypothetical protein AB7O97_06825 [Planctomycetota bacterium]